MSDNPNAREKQPSQPSENIEIPAIPKQTAGAVAGAAVGSIAGPIGAVIGGVAGALAGKAAEKRRGIAAVATKNIAKGTTGRTASLKQIPKRRASRKSVSASRKTGTRSRGKAKRTLSRRSTTAKSRRGTGTRRGSTPGRNVRKRSGGRKKRH